MKGAGRLKKAGGRLTRRFRPAAIILMYHRVIDLQSDPLSLAVSVDRFARQLNYIARTCRPMRLNALVRALQEGTLPQRAVAITFDDGYCDNYRNAYPLLVSARIPATIFVSSDLVDRAQEFWWDDLERILLSSSRLPACLQLSIRAQDFEWQMNSAEHRQRAYGDLYPVLKSLAPEERQLVLQQLTHWADISATGRADYRALTRTELAELSSSDLIEIGGHTRNHPQLSMLSADAQQAEIAGGKQRLEDFIGSAIDAFAYPYGQTADFTDETLAIVRAAGYRLALTTIHGYVERGDDPLRLRRCAVFNWDDDTFKRKLEEFFIIRD